MLPILENLHCQLLVECLYSRFKFEGEILFRNFLKPFEKIRINLVVPKFTIRATSVLRIFIALFEMHFYWSLCCCCCCCCCCWEWWNVWFRTHGLVKQIKTSLSISKVHFAPHFAHLVDSKLLPMEHQRLSLYIRLLRQPGSSPRRLLVA